MASIVKIWREIIMDIIQEFLNKFWGKKRKEIEVSESVSETFKYKRWTIELLYDKEHSDKAKFFRSKVKVVEKNWKKIVSMILKDWESGGFMDIREKYPDKKEFIKHLIPTGIIFFWGTEYGGFEVDIGDKELMTVMGQHNYTADFDKKDKLYHEIGVQG